MSCEHKEIHLSKWPLAVGESREFICNECHEIMDHDWLASHKWDRNTDNWTPHWTIREEKTTMTSKQVLDAAPDVSHMGDFYICNQFYSVGEAVDGSEMDIPCLSGLNHDGDHAGYIKIGDYLMRAVWTDEPDQKVYVYRVVEPWKL